MKTAWDLLKDLARTTDYSGEGGFGEVSVKGRRVINFQDDKSVLGPLTTATENSKEEKAKEVLKTLKETDRATELTLEAEKEHEARAYNCNRKTCPRPLSAHRVQGDRLVDMARSEAVIIFHI